MRPPPPRRKSAASAQNDGRLHRIARVKEACEKRKLDLRYPVTQKMQEEIATELGILNFYEMPELLKRVRLAIGINPNFKRDTRTPIQLAMDPAYEAEEGESV